RSTTVPISGGMMSCGPDVVLSYTPLKVHVPFFNPPTNTCASLPYVVTSCESALCVNSDWLVNADRSDEFSVTTVSLPWTNAMSCSLSRYVDLEHGRYVVRGADDDLIELDGHHTDAVAGGVRAGLQHGFDRLVARSVAVGPQLVPCATVGRLAHH